MPLQVGIPSYNGHPHLVKETNGEDSWWELRNSKTHELLWSERPAPPQPEEVTDEEIQDKGEMMQGLGEHDEEYLSGWWAGIGWYRSRTKKEKVCVWTDKDGIVTPACGGRYWIRHEIDSRIELCPHCGGRVQIKEGV